MRGPERTMRVGEPVQVFGDGGLGRPDAVFHLSAFLLERVMRGLGKTPDTRGHGKILFAFRGLRFSAGSGPVRDSVSFPVAPLLPNGRYRRCMLVLYDTHERTLSACRCSTVGPHMSLPLDMLSIPSGRLPVSVRGPVAPKAPSQAEWHAFAGEIGEARLSQHTAYPLIVMWGYDVAAHACLRRGSDVVSDLRGVDALQGQLTRSPEL